VTGCVTIQDKKVTNWGCTGQLLTVLDAPTALVTENGATVSVTVLSLDSGLMTILMQLNKTSTSLLTGSITTFTLTADMFAAP